MKNTILKRLFLYNSFLFFFFFLLFLIFPRLDIYLSNFFFIQGSFISEKYIIIKDLRNFLKNLMIFIPFVAIALLLINMINKKQKVKSSLKDRTKYVLVGFIIGPIVGCGIIANMYFKDTWGRARPVQVQEFGGTKFFTPPFIKTDQCEKNCSWISGEASAAFSFLVGTILLKNKIFFVINIFVGLLVFFCRISMGGHFFSDNIFAMIFMIYLAILYKNLIYIYLKKRSYNEKNINNNR